MAYFGQPDEGDYDWAYEDFRTPISRPGTLSYQGFAVAPLPAILTAGQPTVARRCPCRRMEETDCAGECGFPPLGEGPCGLERLPRDPAREPF